MAFVVKSDEKYYYTRTGDPSCAETLLFIHGATMTGAGLAPFVDQFSRFNCITVDLPGHGQSDGPTKTRVEGFADAMEFLIAELRRTGVMTDSITVLGYSMGGCISIELALRKTEGIRRVIILSSGAGVKGHTPLVDTFNAMDESTYHSVDLFEHLFGRYTTSQEKEAAIQLLSATMVDDATGLSDLRTACHYDRQEDTSKINLPMLIISGDDDKIIPVDIPLRLRLSVPNSALVIFPYRGHSAIFEEIAPSVKAIQHFIKLHP